MNKLVLLLCLLSLNAFASPITVDVISAPDGLTIKNGHATLTMPSGYVTEQLMTPLSSGTIANKTFDASSNVAKQVRVIYDVPTMGGATSANINLSAGIPAKAIISNVILDVVTAPVALDGSPTIGLSAASGADLLADTAIASLSNQVQGIPNGSTTYMIKMSGATGLTVNVKSGSLSAGKIAIFVDYLISQ